MTRISGNLWLALTLSILGGGPLAAQSASEQLRVAANLTEGSAPGMADFLRSEAAELHCCSTQKFLEAAILYKRAAEYGFTDDPGNLESPVEDLRLAGYFFYYAGEFDRAFSALARVGVIQRDSGNREAAAEAFLEAAHIARQSNDLQRARELLIVSETVARQP